ncbi:MAG: hypothetical protein F6K21_23585 [Symploca sp. SIO2D2]|nr:hypothetical protein [Symploca sp. SIO2D2]
MPTVSLTNMHIAQNIMLKMKSSLKIGITSIVYNSHLNTVLAIGQELKKRGHQVIYYGFFDAKERVLAAGLEFCGIAEVEHPLGTNDKFQQQVSQMIGYDANKFSVKFVENQLSLYLSHLPNILKSASLDGFICDQTLLGLSSITEYLKIPTVQLCCTLAVIYTEFLFRPSPVSPFQDYSVNPLKQIINIIFTQVKCSFLFKNWRKLVNRFRKAHQLPLIWTALGLFQGKYLATIAQLIPELDFPTSFLPRNFYYCGSFSKNISEKDIYFPYEKLSNKPLIYACLGTSQNGNWEAFKLMDKACCSLDVQLVLSFGKKGCLSNFPIDELSANTIAFDYVPQKSLIKKSTLVINHAGLNSALETLQAGKPMICIPICYDQPEVAARMKRVGVAEVVPIEKLTVKRLQDAIIKVLKNDKYQQNASIYQEKLLQTGGVARAADIIETVIRYGSL